MSANKGVMLKDEESGIVENPDVLSLEDESTKAVSPRPSILPVFPYVQSEGFFGRQKRLRKSILSKRKQRQRLVFDNGECNIRNINIKKRRQRYIADIFTTLVDIKWRYILLMFVLAFALSWMLFGFFWWLICFSHGDFEHRDSSKEKREPCIANVDGFTSALLFSIETQHTIGYGYRMITGACPTGIIMLMLQSVFGVVVQALMAGIVFAKLSRPKKRAGTLLFSKNAVICRRDGEYCLLVRVGDMRRSRIVEPHVSALLVRRRVTKEGEVMPLFQHRLEMNSENGSSEIFLAWPVILEHHINSNSPLYDLSERDLHSSNFELIIILEGVVESTGMTAQAKTSYLPQEILWGYRFSHLMTYHKDDGGYIIDYMLFNTTKKVDMPRCSAKNLDSWEEDGSDSGASDEAQPISSAHKNKREHSRATKQLL